MSSTQTETRYHSIDHDTLAALVRIASRVKEHVGDFHRPEENEALLIGSEILGHNGATDVVHLNIGGPIAENAEAAAKDTVMCLGPPEAVESVRRTIDHGKQALAVAKDIAGGFVEMSTAIAEEKGWDALAAIPGFNRIRSADARVRALLMREH